MHFHIWYTCTCLYIENQIPEEHLMENGKHFASHILLMILEAYPAVCSSCIGCSCSFNPDTFCISVEEPKPKITQHSKERDPC